jgi:tRNA 2-thiouridine synthesizing protein A
MDYDNDLDAIGLLCPLPVLKARKRLAGLESGQVLLLRTDDPAAAIDVPHYCAESGHLLKETSASGNTQKFYIQKK